MARPFSFGGFKIGPKAPPLTRTSSAVPPPPNLDVRSRMQSQFPLPAGLRPEVMPVSSMIGRKRAMDEDEYFNDDEDKRDDMAYQPAPGSPGPSAKGRREDDDDDDEEDADPLDAYMQSIEQKAKADLQSIGKKSEKKKEQKGTRDDIEEEDVQEAYFRYMEENPNAGLAQDDDDDIEVEYDADGNPIAPERNRVIDPLTPIDHSTVKYEPFEKVFYTEHEEIAALTPHKVVELCLALGIKVSGPLPPKPVSSFAHFGFDEPMMRGIRKLEYTQPTPIQAQAVPAILLGRDVIGIAKTGSGKTAAFLWPAIVHIVDQREWTAGDGPIALILAPTRELAQQIYFEARRFGKAYNLTCACAFGGGNMYEQQKACEEGCEILVATPGRLIDLIKKDATNLRRVTYLVLDEADRMFDMGFEPQVRSIVNHCRPDRQTLLFSATFKWKIERLARDALIDPVRIVQGDVGEANEDVIQHIEILPAGPEKWSWLTSRLVEFTSTGKVLIFVTKKSNSEELANNLRRQDFHVGLLHGDMSQFERNEVITEFKNKQMPVLVATDVAARGLDIPAIRTVINYDVARDIDTHTHRIGRTGRAGQKGNAYTLVTSKDTEFAPHLVRNLEGANQPVPESLMQLALQAQWFRDRRFKEAGGGGGRRPGIARPGLGMRAARGGFGGPQTSRVTEVRSALKSQLSHSFVSATDTQWKPTLSLAVPSTAKPARAPGEQRKSRWDNN